MRMLLLAGAMLALVACGQPSGESKAPAEGGAGPVTIGSTEHMPDWLLVARTPDGGFVHFNQRAITRGEDGTADIWVQVTYGANQLFTIESESDETVIRYTQERIHYRFQCAEEKFLIAERQIMGPNEAVVARDEPRALWRGVPTTGAAKLVMPIACRAT